MSQEVLTVSPEDVPSKEGKLAGAGLVAPGHKPDVPLGYAELKRDLFVRLPLFQLPGYGGLVRLAPASVGNRDPEPSILGNQRGQGEYAEDAPKLARRISPSRHIYRNAAMRTAQCLRRRVPDYFLKLRATYPCFGHVHILHGDKGFRGEHTQIFNGWGKITLLGRSAGKGVIGKPKNRQKKPPEGGLPHN